MPSIYRLAARALFIAPLPMLCAAAGRSPLTPGMWTFTNTPVSATLDGRVLHDLPVGDITSETTCLTPALAASPAAWLARDLLHDCKLDQTIVAGGRVKITGHCPPQGSEHKAGTLTLIGRYAADSYDLKFTTVSPDENGVMGFDGHMVGRRTGTCAPAH